MENHSLGHLQVTAGEADDCVDFVSRQIAGGEKAYCVPINLTKYIVSKEDQKLREAIVGSSLTIADGIPIVWLSRRVGARNVRRITGIDLSEMLLDRARTSGWSVFLLGASPENLQRATTRLKDRFAGIRIVGSHDGYFTPEETPAILDKVNGCQPDLLLLGLGMPQKEYFIHDHFESLDVRFCITVGGAFDVWAGAKKRTPVMIQKLGLEWFYRSYYDLAKARNILKYGSAFAKELFVPNC